MYVKYKYIYNNIYLLKLHIYILNTIQIYPSRSHILIHAINNYEGAQTI